MSTFVIYTNTVPAYNLTLFVVLSADKIPQKSVILQIGKMSSSTTLTHLVRSDEAENN